MPRVALRVERVLKRHRSLPTRRADRALIGDLASMEWQLVLAREAMDDFLNLERGGNQITYLERLAYLVAAVTGLREVTTDIEPALRRILGRKGGAEAEFLVAAKELENSTAGFSPRSLRDGAG